jgi:hypothetical protein
VGVRGVLSSPRRRRRLLWSGGAALVVAGITFSMIHWQNTSTYKEPPIRYDEPADVVVNPTKTNFAAAKHQGVLEVAAAFVQTAVKRSHVERSFDLASPALKAGYTRRAWATRDIPVQPYPLQFAKYRVKGSFTDSVWLQVAVFPDKAHKAVPAAVFDIVLKPYGNGPGRHWLVDSWAPAGYQGIPSGPLGGVRDKNGNPVASTVSYESKLKSQWWLLVPLSGFLGALLLLAVLAVRGWWRNARAVKRYKSTYL